MKSVTSYLVVSLVLVSCLLCPAYHWQNTRQSFGNLEPLLNSLCARWLSPNITQSSTNQSACISIITPATILILFTWVKVKNGGYLPLSPKQRGKYGSKWLFWFIPHKNPNFVNITKNGVKKKIKRWKQIQVVQPLSCWQIFYECHCYHDCKREGKRYSIQLIVIKRVRDSFLGSFLKLNGSPIIHNKSFHNNTNCTHAEWF